MIAAIFDIDHTIIRGTSMERVFLKYLIKQKIVGGMDIIRTALFVLSHLPDPVYMRSMRPYLRKKEVETILFHGEICFRDRIVPLISEGAMKKIAYHKQEGHTVILLSGTIDILADLLAKHIGVDHYIASCPERKNGYYTGRIIPPIPYREGKREILLSLVAEKGILLRQSFSYGNSLSDRHILECVGNPCAVNPGARFKRMAERKGWNIEYWH